MKLSLFIPEDSNTYGKLYAMAKITFTSEDQFNVASWNSAPKGSSLFLGMPETPVCKSRLAVCWVGPMQSLFYAK